MSTLIIKGTKQIMGSDTLEIKTDEDEIKSFSCISGLAPCSCVVGVSNEPNVRAVDVNAPVLEKIEETLCNEPERMPIRNNGITLIASSFKYDEDKHGWRISLGSNDGIINGGHTAYKIEELFNMGILPKHARVPIRVFESKNLSEEDIADISACLNDSCAPRLSTLIEKRGLTEGLKKIIAPQYLHLIEWKENTCKGKAGVDYITLDDLLMILSLFDVTQYGYHGHEGKKKVSKSPKKVMERYNAEQLNFDYLYPIINDILRLFDEVHVSLTRVAQKTKGKGSVKNINLFCANTLRSRARLGQSTENLPEIKTVFTDNKYTYNLADGFMYIILTAFRANITIENGKVKWVVPDVIEFYRSIEADIWRTILENVKVSERTDNNNVTYRYINVSDNTKQGTAIWNSVYNKVNGEVYKRELKAH